MPQTSSKRAAKTASALTSKASATILDSDRAQLTRLFFKYYGPSIMVRYLTDEELIHYIDQAEHKLADQSRALGD